MFAFLSIRVRIRDFSLSSFRVVHELFNYVRRAVELLKQYTARLKADCSQIAQSQEQHAERVQVIISSRVAES